MSYSYTVKQGDTLNGIAQQHGFSNYKDAGVSSVPSGNFDLIKAGETITLNNHDPNNVKSFGSTPSVISSNDNKQQFATDSGKIDNVAGAFDASILGTKPEDKIPKEDLASFKKANPTLSFKEEDLKKYNEANGVSSDPLFNSLDKAQKEQDVKLEADKIAKKQEYETLYQTSLSAIDATAKATIDSINTTYNKRINEQNRINRINIDRTKAYGLANGGQYTPMDFGDAITGKELEASDKISALESERTSLIAQAKSARDSGASKLLRDKLNDLTKIDEDLRKQLKEVADESEKKYKVLRDIRVEEEKKQKERQTKALKQVSDLAPAFSKEYETMSPKDKDAFIQKIVAQTGLDYASVYSSIESSIMKSQTDALTLAGKKQDLKLKEANTAKAWRTPAPKTTTTPEGFKGTIPTTFTGESDYNAKRAEFVRLNGTKGASHWDAVFPKDPITKDPVYTKAEAPKVTPPAKSKTFDANTMFKSNSGKTYNLPY